MVQRNFFLLAVGEHGSIKVDAAYLDELIMRGLDGSVAYMGVTLIVDNIL